jgi:nitrate/nitrite transporter NarK
VIFCLLTTTTAGPNATTFIVPAECYPTRIRATAHGVSAAAGKIGATIAQLAFEPLVSKGATEKDPHPWLDKVMQIFALFMLCGLLISFLIPETKRKTLEELAGENEQNRAYELRFVSGFFRQEKHDSVHDVTARASSRSLRGRGSRGRRGSLGGIYHKYFRFSG